jgi:gas vesicle protein
MNRSSGRTIVGFIFGAAVGVAAGLLLAPRKGDETWKMLQKNARTYSDDLTRNLGKRFDELKGYVGRVAEEKHENLGKMAEESKETIKKHMPQ